MNKPPMKFYLFGDSICFGQLVNAYKTWAVNLAVELAGIKDYGVPFVVQNAGVNGNTTRQALQRMHYDVTSHRPDFMMIQFGMNDCNYWADDLILPRVSRQSFGANIEEIVDRAVASGVRHCFLNTNHPSLKGGFSHYSNITYDQSNEQYNQLIRNAHENMIGKGKPVTLVDMEKIWLSQLEESSSLQLQSLLLEDGIHLSEEGHLLYTNFLIPKVIEELTGMAGKPGSCSS
jgi:lysophospholipase L1-like esterase